MSKHHELGDISHLQERAELLAEIFEATDYSISEEENAVLLEFGNNDPVKFTPSKINSLTERQIRDRYGDPDE